MCKQQNRSTTDSGFTSWILDPGFTSKVHALDSDKNRKNQKNRIK